MMTEISQAAGQIASRLLIVFVAAFPPASHAYLSIDDVFRAKESPKKEISFAADMYVGGMMEALWNANLASKDAGANYFFCLPEPQHLQTEELTQLGYFILRKAKTALTANTANTANVGALRKAPASLHLLAQLQMTFPCGDSNH